MNDLKDFVDVFIEPFLIIVTLLLVFWKGYLGKKAENAATKEDIQGITKLVEDVKVSFRKEFADYELLGKHQFTLENEKRKAILEYNDALHTLINNTLNSMYDEELLNYKKPELLHKNFYRVSSTYLLAKERLIMLSDDDKIEKAHKAIYKRISEMARLILDHALKFYSKHDILSEPDEVQRDILGIHPERDKDWKEMQKNVNDIFFIVKDDLQEIRKILNRKIVDVYKKSENP